jgi:hypothetical protein
VVSTIPHVHLYNFADGEARRMDMADGLNRGIYFGKLLKQPDGVRVYMDGVTTGLTIGKFKDVMIDMRLAWLEMSQTAMLTPPAEDKSLDSTGLTYEDLCA